MTERFRVLHLVTRLERGGSSDCTLWQAMGAARRGCEVTVASGPTGRPTPLLDVARRVPGLGLVPILPLGRAPHPVRDLRALAAIVALLRRTRFDVIHLHTSKAGALGRVAAALTGQTRRVIHQPHGHLFYGYYGRAGTALVLAAERWLARFARLQVTLTDAGTEEHLRHGIGRREQYRTLPSGVDFRGLRDARRRRDACRRRLGFARDDFVIGALCRLEAIKGTGDLVRAFMGLAPSRPRLRLFIAGEGPQRPELLKLIHAGGLQNRATILGGWADPLEILPACDAVVLASRNEGMGRALVEAMVMAIPVVATAVGGVPDLLEEGRAGLLVPPGDPVALAGALARLVDDPGFALALGRTGHARSLSYGAGRMVHSMLRLYREVAA
ncbi:MAG TPA: glycosyltransferase [Patescibacteria group bacterium]|nr:glycosyltransferase [Patescibacteria group bacterium]